MSSDEEYVSKTSHDLAVPSIDVSESLTNIENFAENTVNPTDDISDEMTPKECLTENELKISAPPRRKLAKSNSLRRTDIPVLLSNQKQFDDSLSQTDPNSCHPNDTTLVSTKCYDFRPNDCNHLQTNVVNKCQHFTDSSTQCPSSDLIGKEVQKSCVQLDIQTDNGLTSRIQLMERMIRWKTRWFTSDEAKARRRQRFNRFLYYVKVFLTHLFSTTGLCLLVAAYSCMGALIFTSLESDEEVKHRIYVEQERTQFAEDLWNYTLSLNIFYGEKWKREAIERLKKFEDRIVTAVREEGYGDTADKWTFSGALLYSVTVITTIGYGNVTCKTNWGRIVTMIYALIGIPVMFLCLANLGNLMAETFRFSYKRICCLCFCCCDRFSNKYNKKQNKSSVKRKKEKIELKNSSKHEITENEKELKVIYSENDDQKIRSIIALTPSTPPTTTSVTSSQTSSPLKSFSSTDVRNELTKQNNDIIVIQESGVKVDDRDDRVPIWLVIVLVIGYIMAGAFMFSLWEEKWTLLEGAYFCFTTLTTIGFGDLVPGSAKYSENKEEQTKFIICCAYLIVGLSLLAMSFNLVQEEIVIKSKEIGRRMGFIPQKQTESDHPITSV